MDGAADRPDIVKPVIRMAGREDCRGIAGLFLIASDGLAAYTFGTLRGRPRSLMAT